MANYNYPTDRIFIPRSIIWSFRDNARVFESQLSGAIQSTSVPGTRWACSLIFDNHLPEDRAQIEGFFSLIRRQNRIVMHRLDRPKALGTINSTGVLLNSVLAQFGSVAVLKNCGANKLLKAGSMIGIGSQLFMTAFDAVSDGSGIMSVTLSVPSRLTHGADTAVTLDKPTAKWMYNSNGADFARSGQVATPLTIDLVEVF